MELAQVKRHVMQEACASLLDYMAPMPALFDQRVKCQLDDLEQSCFD